MARNPKPTALKVLHGDDRCRLPKPGPRAAGTVERPAWLDDTEPWDRLAPDLIRKGVLTPWDVPLFSRYCWLDARTRELMTLLEIEGAVQTTRNGVRKNPLVQILRDFTGEMLAIAAKFGLTPVDRQR